MNSEKAAISVVRMIEFCRWKATSIVLSLHKKALTFAYGKCKGFSLSLYCHQPGAAGRTLEAFKVERRSIEQIAAFRDLLQNQTFQKDDLFSQ